MKFISLLYFLLKKRQKRRKTKFLFRLYQSLKNFNKTYTFTKKFFGEDMFSFLDEISTLSGLPLDIINKGFRVINLSNRAVYVEGFTGLIDVDSQEIGIKLKKGILKLNGDNLKIKNMNLETILVTGDIRMIEMC